MKKYVILFLVATLAFACLLTGCEGTSQTFSRLIDGSDVVINQRNVLTPSTEAPITVDELYLPEGLRETDCGLYLCGYNGKLTRSTDSNVYYDPDKPFVVYFHGNAWDFGYNRYETYKMGELETDYQNWLCNYWLDRGYNVAIYYWSQFADEVVLSTTGCGFKIWSTNAGPKMRWAYEGKDGSREVEEEDMPNCCLAEMFGAYYFDLFDRYGFNGNEIRFTGHSMGAQFALAASSYVTTKALGGTVNSRYIPDRVTLYDGYYEALPAETNYCSWLNRYIGEDGTLGLCKDIVVDLKELGVAIEQITTTEQTISSAKVFNKDGLCQSLYDEIMILNYSSEYLGTTSSKHEISKKYYIYMNSLPNTIDASDSLKKAYAFSPKTPTAYVYARMGTAYDMEKNYSFVGEDDVQYSTTITNAKVAGFAFFDKNGNGINDDGIYNRLEGVKATLIVDGIEVASTTTALSGYYSFDVDSSSLGKDVKVKFDINGKYAFTKLTTAVEGDAAYMATNDAGEDGLTASAKLDNEFTLIIKNCGLIAK